MRFLGLLLMVGALLIGLFGAMAYLGWQQGLTARDENAVTALATAINRQVELAVQDVADGNTNLALTRLEWVLARDPQHAAALELREEALGLQGARLTPRPTATLQPAATALAPLVAGTSDFDQRLNGLRALLDDEAWVQAAEEIIRFQREQPDYRRAETDQLLYDAYLNAGLALLDSRSVESGLYYLTLAGKLGDLPQEALDRRGWAELYLKGISFYAVDWQATIVNFRDLCLAAPFYQDSCGVLYDALVSYGDQFAAGGEWCPAERYYREALRYDSSSALREKVSTATETCLIATPTPEVPITDTLPIEDGTPPVPVDQP